MRVKSVEMVFAILMLLNAAMMFHQTLINLVVLNRIQSSINEGTINIVIGSNLVVLVLGSGIVCVLSFVAFLIFLNWSIRER